MILIRIIEAEECVLSQGAVVGRLQGDVVRAVDFMGISVLVGYRRKFQIRVLKILADDCRRAKYFRKSGQ